MANDKLTLAITSVGNLLLRQEIKQRNEARAIRSVRLTVPDYQRPYKWTAKNAIQLLDDIVEARKENKEVYRVGTLILHRESKDGNIRYNIVDGQQRIITFALLLKALGEEDIEFLKQELSDNPFNRHNIPNNLRTFQRRTEVKDNESEEGRNRKWQISQLKDYVENQCELVVVITDDISEAFQFFDSQNARGKSLYPHDLLKAYHLREMREVDEQQTEKIVNDWESERQHELASLFGDYLYRIKEWIHGNRAYSLNEQNIYKFKGLTKKDRTPYAQFYKGSFAYADMVNQSYMPFVSGSRAVNAFQIDSPIIAGKPFFEYAKHYFALLKDIKDNSKYEGFYVKGNKIVETLDAYCSNGTGNRITRLLFDTALLLYVDRFCPETFPTKAEIDMFEDFVVFAFVWAYSLRAQYKKLGWSSAQNYILGWGEAGWKVNSMNLYKLISEAYSPETLLSALADKIRPVTPFLTGGISHEQDANGIYTNYQHYFKENKF